MTQAHTQFKVFINDGSTLSEEFLSTVSEAASQLAPKSVGVEYLEGKGKIVLTLGYRDDEPAYKVKLTAKKLGVLDLTEEAIDAALSAAAKDAGAVICHEFYVTAEGEFVTVFLTQVG